METIRRSGGSETLEAVLKTVEEMPEKVEKKRFVGYKAEIILPDGRKIPVRHETIKTKAVDEKLQVVSMVGDVEVFWRKISNEKSKYGWVNADKTSVFQKSQVRHYQILPDGSKREVSKFQKTKAFVVQKYKPFSELDEWKPEEFKQIWSDTNVVELQAFAKELVDRDNVAVVRYSNGNTFKELWGLIYPLYKDGHFVLVMKGTRSYFEINRWMPINGHVSTVEKIEAKVVNVLPEM